MCIVIIVWTLSLTCPPQEDITMSHCHGVDTYSLRCCRKCRQLDLMESKSPTPNSEWNLWHASHWMWADVHDFVPQLMVTITIVLIVMVMVMVVVMVMVLKAFDQLCWLPTSMFPQTSSLLMPSVSGNCKISLSPYITVETPVLVKCSSLSHGSETGWPARLQAVSHAGSQSGSQSGQQVGCQAATVEMY